MNEALSESKFDSTQILLNSLNNKIVEFEKQNQVLRDSVVALTKTIEKAGIKTEFYTDQLNFQLFWFSIILAVIGLISWNGIIKPIKDRLIKIEENSIPQITNHTKKIIDDKMVEFEDQFSAIAEQSIEGISWGLKSLSTFYYSDRNWTGYILFNLRHIDLCFKDDSVEVNEEAIIKDLKKIDEINIRENISSQVFKENFEEVQNILAKVKKCDLIPIASDLAFKISTHYSQKEDKPETSYDADNSEYAGPRTITSTN